MHIKCRDINLCNTNKNTGTEEEEKNEATMELEIYGIKCEGLCNKSFDPEEVFICNHIECANNFKIYCNQCGKCAHEINADKHHIFDPSQRYVKCVKYFLNPDQSTFAVKSIYYYP